MCDRFQNENDFSPIISLQQRQSNLKKVQRAAGACLGVDGTLRAGTGAGWIMSTHSGSCSAACHGGCAGRRERVRMLAGACSRVQGSSCRMAAGSVGKSCGGDGDRQAGVLRRTPGSPAAVMATGERECCGGDRRAGVRLSISFNHFLIVGVVCLDSLERGKEESSVGGCCPLRQTWRGCGAFDMLV
jgi:hypothetical protein